MHLLVHWHRNNRAGPAAVQSNNNSSIWAPWGNIVHHYSLKKPGKHANYTHNKAELLTIKSQWKVHSVPLASRAVRCGELERVIIAIIRGAQETDNDTSALCQPPEAPFYSLIRFLGISARECCHLRPCFQAPLNEIIDSDPENPEFALLCFSRSWTSGQSQSGWEGPRHNVWNVGNLMHVTLTHTLDAENHVLHLGTVELDFPQNTHDSHLSTGII